MLCTFAGMTSLALNSKLSKFMTRSFSEGFFFKKLENICKKNLREILLANWFIGWLARKLACWFKVMLRFKVMIFDRKTVRKRKENRFDCFFIYMIGNLKLRSLTLSWRRSLSYRNQSIDLQSKWMNWFLYDSDFCHERVNLNILKVICYGSYYSSFKIQFFSYSNLIKLNCFQLLNFDNCKEILTGNAYDLSLSDLRACEVPTTRFGSLLIIGSYQLSLCICDSYNL